MSVTDLNEINPAEGTPRPNGDGSSAGSPAKSKRIRQALQDGARKGAEAARAQTAAVGRKLTETTQERPISSVSVAMAFGLLTGFAAGVFVARAFQD